MRFVRKTQIDTLREYRKKLKLTQSDVAKELNITQGQLSLFELGKSLLNANQILVLCELFKCSPNDLLGFRGVHTVTYAIIDKTLEYVEENKKHGI